MSHPSPDAPPVFFDCDVLAGATLRAQHPGLDGLALQEELRRCGIARALVHTFALGPCAWMEQNRGTIAAAQAAPNLVPCPVLPQFGTSLGESVRSEVVALLDAGARCFRLESELGPASGPLLLEGFPDCDAVWRLLERTRVPVFIPAAHLPERNRRYGYDLDAVVALCARHPALPVILLGAPYALERQLAHALERAPNLHLSVARLGLFGQLEAFVRAFGAHRFLFGSGLPFNDPAIAAGLVRYAGLEPQQKAQIASENLERLLLRHE